MKYTIHGLQQEKLIECRLDNDDALILSVFRDMYASASIESKIIDDERYIWVNQNNLIIREIPILGSRAKIFRKIKNLEELGFIKRKILFSKNGVKGKYAYLTITSKIDYLTEYTMSQNETTPCLKMRLPMSQNETTHVSKRDIKDPSTKDYPIKDYTTTKEDKSSSSLQGINLDLKEITKENLKKFNLSKEDIDLLEIFIKNSKYDDLDRFVVFAAKGIKKGTITKENINKKVSKKSNSDKIQNFKEKDYDYDALERELLGWDD